MPDISIRNSSGEGPSYDVSHGTPPTRIGFVLVRSCVIVDGNSSRVNEEPVTPSTPSSKSGRSVKLGVEWAALANGSETVAQVVEQRPFKAFESAEHIRAEAHHTTKMRRNTGFYF